MIVSAKVFTYLQIDCLIVAGVTMSIKKQGCMTQANTEIFLTSYVLSPTEKEQCHIQSSFFLLSHVKIHKIRGNLLLDFNFRTETVFKLQCL